MRERDDLPDEVLRRVPLPALLRAGMSIESLFDDAAIDRLIGLVEPPAGLADRVRAAARTDDARRTGVVDLDRLASAVPPPPSPTVPRPAMGGLTRFAREAGRVVAALALAVLLAVAGIEFSRRLEGPSGMVGDAGLARGQAPRPVPAERSAAVRPETRRATTAPRPPDAAEVRTAEEPSAAPDLVSAPVPPGADDESARPDEAVRPAAERITVRGAPVLSVDRVRPTTMRTVSLPGSERRAVPRSAAFDIAFEMAHGEAPFVEPSADAALASDRPPLTLRTEGYDDLLRGTGGRGRGRLRVEEVLAAVPPPPMLARGGEGVRFGLHAVRSGRTYDGKPTVLVEVAAFAAGDAAPAGEPLRATLLVDQSAAGDPHAWPRICRGLAALAGRLGPADRVTVVLCGPRPRVALRDAAPTALAAAATSWETLPATAAADLDTALEIVRTEGILAPRTIVVAHAVTLEQGRTPVREALAEWHRCLAATGGDPLVSTPVGGLRFIVVDPSATAPARQGEPTFGLTSPDATAIRRELLRQVTGRDTLVARQCRLEVRFDPRRVSRYRIVGHRQSAVESLADGSPAPLDLHAGETLRAVYEIVPVAENADGLVKATLRWREPGGGASRLDAEDRDRGDRTAALPSPHGCEILLAAWLGELAAGSAHQPQPRQVAAVVGRIADEWRKRGDLTPFGAALVATLDDRPEGRQKAR